jgi:hypothetical protein
MSRSDFIAGAVSRDWRDNPLRAPVLAPVLDNPRAIVGWRRFYARDCKGCGGPFVTMRRSAQFCSPKCGKAARRRDAPDLGGQ